MKHTLYFFFLLLVPHLVTGQVAFETFRSVELKGDRSLNIYIPESYQKNPDKHYPLTILLDAEFLFDIYVSNAKLFASKNEAPEQIIIGVNQNRANERARDCSYDKETSLPTEEGYAFQQFIYELIQHAEENYRVSPFRTIAGRTLTGNFINYFFIEESPVFNAFISINPYLAKEALYFLSEKERSLNSTTYFYLSGGAYLNKNRLKSIEEVSSLFDNSENEFLNFKYDSFGKNKTASIGSSIANALAFVFKKYAPISKEEYKAHIEDLSPSEAIEYLKNKYEHLENLFQSNLKLRPADIFAIEPVILDKENGSYLKKFGEMINQLYGESYIGNYYIGRYYETGKNYKRAIRHYKNGYIKFPKGDPNAAEYYKNIERVLQKEKGVYLGNEGY